MPVDDILLEAEEKMIKTEEVVVNEFAGVRTGKKGRGGIVILAVGGFPSATLRAGFRYAQNDRG